MDQNPIPLEKISLPELSPKHEAELQEIGKQAAERRVDYSSNGIEKEKKEVFKEVLEEMVQTQSGSLTQFSQASVQPTSQSGDLDNKSHKLQELVNIAATEGPIEATLRVKRIGDPWLADRLHDVLIHYHDELVKRSKLKEE